MNRPKIGTAIVVGNEPSVHLALDQLACLRILTEHRRVRPWPTLGIAIQAAEPPMKKWGA